MISVRAELLKFVVGLLLLTGVLAAGAGTFALRQPAEKQAETPKAEGQRPTRIDRFGDPLPPGAVARIGTSRLRANWGFFSLAFSPDGKVLAMGDDEVLRFWDVANGKEIRHFNAGIGQVNVLAFSADGKYLAAGGGACMGLWEASTAKRLSHLKGQEGHTDAVAFSPDGKTLVCGGYGNTIHVWEIASGKELRQLYPPGSHNDGGVGGSITGTVEHVQFSPSGGTLFSQSFASDTGVAVFQSWDPTTGKEQGKAKRYVVKRPDWLSVFYAPDGRLALIQFSDHRIRALNLDSGQESPFLPDRSEEVLLAFSPDSKSVALWSEKDKQIRLRNVKTGAKLLQLPYPFPIKPNKLAFRRDGKTLAVGDSSTGALHFWDVASGKEFFPFGEAPDSVSAIAFLPDGKTLVSGNHEGRLHLWVADTGKELRRFQGPPQGIDALSLSSDGKTLATTGAKDELWIWKLPEGEIKRRFAERPEGKAGSRSDWALSPDGRMLACSDKKGTVVLMEAATGKEKRRIEEAGQPLMFSPDGRILATFGRQGTICLWDAATEALWRRLGESQAGRDYWDWVACSSFSPDGKTLALVWGGHGKPGDVEIWDVTVGQKLPRFNNWLLQLPGWVNGTCFSADGNTILLRVENNEEVVVVAYDLFTANELGKFTEQKKETNDGRGHSQTLFLSPDSRLLATLDWGSPVLVWDVSRLTTRPRKPRKLSATELSDLWSDLGRADLDKVYNALGKLLDAPAPSVRFVQEHVQAVAPVDPRRIQQLLADLDSDRFETRAKAERELEKLEELAEPALRRALRERPALEMRRRIEGLLKRLQGPITSSETLRQLRAVEVGEHIGSPEARQVLRMLATGALGAHLTREAKAALDRLEHHSIAAP